ncbi:RHS repeat-associated core domain-containing protein [Pseudomonadota bacterium]
MRWVAVNDPIVTLSEQTHFIHYDHLGSPRSVTNRDQAIIWNWESNPFGDSLPNQDPDGDSSEFVLNLRFPGQYYDAESGLHYNYFRTYDPETGRYLESDPIGLRSSLNTFAYVDNNPVNAVDPKGLIKLYGSWCGPDWTGGFRKSYDELGSVERSAALPPVDNLDQCCQVHDITYSDCRSDYPCDPELRQRCFQNADRRLSQCANTSGGGQSPQFLMFGNPRKRIEDYMKDSIPEAEENAASCGCE